MLLLFVLTSYDGESKVCSIRRPVRTREELSDAFILHRCKGSNGSKFIADSLFSMFSSAREKRTSTEGQVLPAHLKNDIASTLYRCLASGTQIKDRTLTNALLHQSKELPAIFTITDSFGAIGIANLRVKAVPQQHVLLYLL
jgi:hypothetical protein